MEIQKFGPGTYAEVQAAIQEAGLVPPTMAETASLIHPAYCSDSQRPEFDDIKSTIRNRGLWAFTGTLYVLNKVAYVQDRPQIRDGLPFMQEADLVAKLEAGDSSVRFVPFGFNIGTMKPSDLGKNAYVIALAGEEGAEKLAEAAGKFRFSPYLWCPRSVDKALTRVSALDSNWGLGGRRLRVDGDDIGDNGGGCGFGVSCQVTSEASRAKK